jgi:outer membrane protein, heavy metal efflux system
MTTSVISTRGARGRADPGSFGGRANLEKGMPARMRTTWLAALLCLAQAGAAAGAQPPPPGAHLGAPVAEFCPPPSQPLTLPELLDLAAHNNPDLVIVRARAEAARGKLIQAGLYLNPTFSVRSDEIGSPNGPVGFVGVTFTQEFVTAGKLKLARAAAAHGVAAADWDAVTAWYLVATRVRLAYVDALAARLAVQMEQGLVRLAEQGLGAAQKLQKAEAGSEPDVLRARVELEQERIRLGVAQRRAEATWRQLAVAVGVAELPGDTLAGSLEVAAPLLGWQPLLATALTRSSEVQAAQALSLQAEGLLARARAEAVPNFYLQVRPIYSNPDRTAEAMVEVGGPLPLWNRNQGNIAAARADLTRAHATIRQVELSLAERLNLAFQRYQAARQQVEAYEREILKSARESLRLVVQGYESGDPKYGYTTVLQAQLVLFQARLVYVTALGDLWRAVAEIGGLVQADDLPVGQPPPPAGCPPPPGDRLPPAPPPGQLGGGVLPLRPGG